MCGLLGNTRGGLPSKQKKGGEGEDGEGRRGGREGKEEGGLGGRGEEGEGSERHRGLKKNRPTLVQLLN